MKQGTIDGTLSRRSFLTGAAAAGALAAASGLAGCAPTQGEPMSETGKGGGAGIYEARAQVQAGDLCVHVAYDGEAITKVDVVEYTDYPTIVMLPSAQTVADRIVEAQSTNVDAVSGATLASMAVMTAVRDCLDQAGAKGFDAMPDAPEVTPGEDVEVDVLVVGSGAGGNTATLAAAYADFNGVDSGLKVMMIEKLGFVGGTSVLSGGGVFASAPIDQPPTEQAISEIMEILQDRNTLPVNESIVRKLMNVAGQNVLDLQALGCAYDVSGRTSYSVIEGLGIGDTPDTVVGTTAPTSTCVYSPTPLCHSVGITPFNWGMAHELFDFFEKRREVAANVEVRVNTAAKEILTDESGAVVGVKVADPEHEYTIYAKKVILATGGITKNPDLVAKYAPKDVNTIPWCSAGDTGDAVTMCEPLGAQVVGDHLLGYLGTNARYGAWGDYGPFHYGGAASIHVNIEGKRYENELFVDPIVGGFGGNLCYTHLMDQPEGRGFGIVDSSHPFVSFLQNSIITDCVWSADTIEGLAEQIGVPAENLTATIDAYNQSRDSGVVDEFGTPVEHMIAMNTPPYYACANNGCAVGGLVGLKCNEDFQLLGADDEPIPNLYGVGEVVYGGNIVTTHEGGWGVGVSLHGGRIAGEHAKAAILGA